MGLLEWKNRVTWRSCQDPSESLIDSKDLELQSSKQLLRTVPWFPTYIEGEGSASPRLTANSS